MWEWGKIRPFLQEHDVVVVGYRGVDGSTVLDCPEVTKALRASDDPLSEEALVNVGKAWRESAQRFHASGIDLDGYTMLECIDDQEALCNALGYGRIDLLSESYGTRVAYLYGLKYPGRILRSAMIAVNPPGHFAWDAATTDAQLRRYAELWTKDSISATRSPDLYKAVRNALTAMPRRWLLFPIDPGKVRVTAFALLFQRKTAAMVFDAFVAADNGDPSGLALMSLAYDYVVPSLMVWGDLASKAVSADYDPRRDPGADTGSMVFPLGAPLSRLLWGPQPCAQWPTGRLPEEYRMLRRSDVPTLLVSGSVDFSTPAIFATRELLPLLPNGKQIILSECGHVNDLWYTEHINIRPILMGFFRTGEVEAVSLPYVPMDFRVSWGFPVIAKAVVGAVMFLIVLFVSGGTIVAKRFVRRLRVGRKT